MEHRFKSLEEYMFSSEVLCKLSRYSMPSDKNTKLKKSNRSKKVINNFKENPDVKKTEMFKPYQRDTIFWCFFVAVNGIDKYNMNKNHIFELEKSTKIEYIEKLRKIKPQLKAAKIKLNKVENELINNPRISAYTLNALALFHQKNVMYVNSLAYYNFNYGVDKIVIEKIDKINKLYLTNISDKFMKCEKYNFLIDIIKPIKGISGYKLSELQEMAGKLSIDIRQDNSKPKLKKCLYEDLVKKIGKLHEVA